MQKMKLFIALLSLCIVFCSCKQQQQINEYEKYIHSVFEKSEIAKVSFIIIIPNQGCAGCINYLEEFYSEYSNQTDLKFVFTNVLSLKVLRHKLSINQMNTYIDLKNEALKYYPSDKKLYPCILELKNGRIKNIYYQSPVEDGLSNVKKRL